MKNLDSFDYKILKIVQSNNKVTSGRLAKEVGLSSSACQRRLNAMRKIGIIEKDVSVLDRNKLNRKLVFKWQSIRGGSINSTYKISAEMFNLFIKTNDTSVFENGFNLLRKL